MPSAYPIDPNSNQSLADKNNGNRLGNFQAQQKPDDHVVATSGINPYYSPGMHAANPISNSTAAESTGKPIMLNPIAPPVPSATPNITLNSGFQSGNSPAPFGTLSPIASPTPSNLTINPTFQSGNPGQAPLAGASASPAVTSLPPTTTLTPNAGIANGLVEPHATASMKITPQNGISNGMPAPNSAVNAPAPVGQAAGFNPSAEDIAKFNLLVGGDKNKENQYNPHSKADVTSMKMMLGQLQTPSFVKNSNPSFDPTMSNAQFRKYQSGQR
jgi:hypothetical protein